MLRYRRWQVGLVAVLLAIVAVAQRRRAKSVADTHGVTQGPGLLDALTIGQRSRGDLE